LTCGLCTTRFTVAPCPHCIPILASHDGSQVVRALELCTGTRIRPLSEVTASRDAHRQAGQRLAADAMAQIRATPARPVREGLAEAVAFAEEERHARRVAAAQGGAP
jgi:hypothetical protein